MKSSSMPNTTSNAECANILSSKQSTQANIPPNKAQYAKISPSKAEYANIPTSKEEQANIPPSKEECAKTALLDPKTFLKIF